MLSIPYPTGNKIREAASSRLGVQLKGPPMHWGWGAGDAFGIEPKRQPMAVIFLIDRTFEAFLQKVVGLGLGLGLGIRLGLGLGLGVGTFEAFLQKVALLTYVSK